MNPEKDKPGKKKKIKIERVDKSESDEKAHASLKDSIEPESAESVEQKAKVKTVESESEESADDIIVKLKDELKLAQDDLIRERASFLNYRKRVEEEKFQIRKYAAQDLLFDLIRLLDYFEESMKFESSHADTQTILMGVKFTVDEFNRILEKNGVKAVDTSIPFDPRYHEAFGADATSDKEPGTILKVHRKGYMYKDRVLRSAMVTVATKQDSDENEQNDTEDEESREGEETCERTENANSSTENKKSSVPEN
jgi:molecular chaperone GrpE